MNILIVHNSYQHPGGEDRVFEMEGDLLEAHGHRVTRFRAHNNELTGLSKPRLFANTIWNQDTYQYIRNVIRSEHADIVHVHNTFPLLSPSVYYAAAAEQVPVVQTLHNYRLLCPAATFYRAGEICESCAGRSITLPAVVHSCYRQSMSASLASTAMLGIHRTARTWKRKVSAFIALTGFAREKFIEAGFPAEKIHVKPNFVDPDPGLGAASGGFALFIGRLTQEKGILTLLKAWQMARPDLPLEILGDGPLAGDVRAAAEVHPNICWNGWVSRDILLQKLKKAALLVFPSEWYEPFGLTIVEAFATGTPVVASRLGSIASMVDHRRTGVLYGAGDPEDLAAQVQWCLRNPDAMQAIRRNARLEYEQKYTSSSNYHQLMAIYGHVLPSGARVRVLSGDEPEALKAVLRARKQS